MIIVLIIISIISITALVMACIAFSRTFKHNRERFSDNYNKGNYGWAFKAIDPKNITNIFELGAHDGNDTEILSKLYPNSTIIAVEALPEFCDKIRKRKLPNVQIIQKAITDKQGNDIVFHRANKQYQASGSIYGSTEGQGFHDVMKNKLQSIKVKTTTIDALVKETGIVPSIILMDLQGAELLALKGAIKTLDKCKYIVSEGGYVPLYKGASTIHDVTKFVNSKHYKCIKCNGQSCKAVQNNHSKGWTDCLYERDNKTPRFSDKDKYGWVKSLSNTAKKIYSQNNQDGIIEKIFEKIGTKNSPPFCIEFGFNSNTMNGGSGANIANLVLNKKWDKLLLDGRYENKTINLHKHLLYPDNIIDIFKKYKVPRNPEYISIDVDSIDLWLFKAILESEYHPMLFSVEYNANFPIDYAITFPNNKSDRWEEDRLYGASLKALYLVAKNYNYHLIAITRGLDLFFIRGDLIDKSQIPPLKYWRKYTGWSVHSKPKKSEKTLAKAKRFLDYEEFVQNGNLEKSRQKAWPIIQKYLYDR